MSSFMSWMPDDLDPIAILLTSSSSNGDRLLFRYPYFSGGDSGMNVDSTLSINNVENNDEVVRRNHSIGSVMNQPQQNSELSSYSLLLLEDTSRAASLSSSSLSFLEKGQLTHHHEAELVTLLTVQKDMCDTKLDVKVEDVVFVGYPCLDDAASMFTVAFVMRAVAPPGVIHSYYRLARQIACAIRHEEVRIHYLKEQRKLIHSALDKHAIPDVTWGNFAAAHKDSSLCQELQQIKDNITQFGKVFARINNWIPISHCLPHKVYAITPDIQVDPNAVQHAIAHMRPYHTILLLQDPATPESDLARLSDANPTLCRLLRFLGEPTAPTTTLQHLALETDITYSHLLNLASSLVLWGHAIIIYPLCEANVYIPAPGIDLNFTEELLLDFAKQFAALCLPELLSYFSVPLPLHAHFQHLPDAAQKTRLITWLLRRRLLIQMHTYVTLVLNLSYHQLPSKSSRSHSSSSSSTTTSSSNSSAIKDNKKFDPTVFNELKRLGYLSLCEQDWEPQMQLICSQPGFQHEKDKAIFLRLLPHFTGQCHIEEIMFQANLGRVEVARYIDKFAPLMLVSQLPDPVTSCFAGIGE